MLCDEIDGSDTPTSPLPASTTGARASPRVADFPCKVLKTCRVRVVEPSERSDFRAYFQWDRIRFGDLECKDSVYRVCVRNVPETALS
jgi:hypothetical protein